MEKESYISPEIKIILLDEKNIITSSIFTCTDVECEVMEGPECRQVFCQENEHPCKIVG